MVNSDWKISGDCPLTIGHHPVPLPTTNNRQVCQVRQHRQRPPTPPTTANDRQRRPGRVSPNPWRSWQFSSAKDRLPMTCDNCASANGLADFVLFQTVCLMERLKG